MDPSDVHEWGGFDLQDSGLMQFRYENVLRYGDYDEKKEQAEDEGGVHTTSFAKCMDVSILSTPEEAIELYKEQDDEGNESILVLGCGTSKVGEQLLANSFVGPVLQLDVSSKVIKLMTQRYDKYLKGASVKRMEFIVDDARGLTSLSPGSVGGGVVDKGLIDVLHQSADVMSMTDDNGSFNRGHSHETEHVRDIVNSVHRVLRPERPFVFFSKSCHEYILRRTLGSAQWNKDTRSKWMSVEVIKLVDFDVYLYRFVKADVVADRAVEATANSIRISRLSKKRRKR